MLMENQDIPTASRSAPESRLRTPIFKKGFENPRNLREGSLSGQLQSGCGSRSEQREDSDELRERERASALSAVFFQIKPKIIAKTSIT